jgi:hypothetical protein
MGTSTRNELVVPAGSYKFSELLETVPRQAPNLMGPKYW